MNDAREVHGTTENGGAAPEMGGGAPFTEEELLAQDAEALPHREAMSTLIWAPAPSAIVAPPVEEIVGDEGI